VEENLFGHYNLKPLSEFSNTANALLCCIFGVNDFVLLSTKEVTEKISAGAIC
jgi:hypothetical protein